MVAEMNHYDGIIFLGGDSDFEPLLSELRNNGKYIICVGKRKSTAIELVDIAHKFIELNEMREKREKRE